MEAQGAGIKRQWATESSEHVPRGVERERQLTQLVDKSCWIKRAPNRNGCRYLSMRDELSELIHPLNGVLGTVKRVR